MNTVEINKRPVIINGAKIVRIEIAILSFETFVQTAQETHALPGVTNGTKWKVMNNRLRMKKQLSAIDDKGGRHKFDDQAIMQLPIEYAKQINDKLNDQGEAEDGQVISSADADGISSPILFRLGTPFKMVSTQGEMEIEELEFLAKTYGDVEEVLAEGFEPAQALTLIRTVAKPICPDVSLLRIPASAVSQITLSDGIDIQEKVLPRFFE